MPKTKGDYDKTFLEEFAKQIAIAKQKAQKEEIEFEKEEAPVKVRVAKEKIRKIGEIEKKIMPSHLKEAERQQMLARLRKLSVEREKAAELREEEIAEREPIPKPTPSAMIAPPTVESQLVPPPYYKIQTVVPIPLPPAAPRRTMQAPQVPQAPAAPKTIQKPKVSLATSIDLGKLNTFVQDKTITLIQCDGEGVPIKIVKQGKVSETVISLNETEIKDMVKRFADRTNQAITEPIFKTQLGNLALTAVTSTFTGSRFVISKI